MKKSGAVVLASAVSLMLVCGFAFSQEKVAAKAAAPEAVEKQPAASPFVMAVLNFDTGTKETTSFGEAIPDLLTAFLSADEKLQLVERAQVKKILDELALSQTGIIDEETKAKIGRMTGAKFLVTGRAMIIGKSLFVIAKVMSSETGLVGAVSVKGPTDGKLDEIVGELATKISTYMAAKGASMMPKVMTQADIVAALQKKLEGKELPKFAVLVRESHVGHPIIDPAAETEVSYLLKAVGATLVSTSDAGMSEWAKDFLKETGKTVPTGLSEADIIIVGEGLSEFAGTTEKLISVKARVEMKAVDVSSGKILAVGRGVATGVDLAENIAAKSALQKAAGDIALTLIPEAVSGHEKAVASEKLKAATKK